MCRRAGRAAVPGDRVRRGQRRSAVGPCIRCTGWSRSGWPSVRGRLRRLGRCRPAPTTCSLAGDATGSGTVTGSASFRCVVATIGRTCRRAMRASGARVRRTCGARCARATTALADDVETPGRRRFGRSHPAMAREREGTSRRVERGQRPDGRLTSRTRARSACRATTAGLGLLPMAQPSRTPWARTADQSTISPRQCRVRATRAQRSGVRT